ncbi:hypothetical protein [Ideonella sp.]|uniref:hypothetical protein n=1 Tax=Ideonella sp. TaxID=1929293 RepID=UPI0035AECA8A
MTLPADHLWPRDAQLGPGGVCALPMAARCSARHAADGRLVDVAGFFPLGAP